MRTKQSDSPKAMTGQGSESARKALEHQLKAKPKHFEAPPAPHKSRPQHLTQPSRREQTGR